MSYTFRFKFCVGQKAIDLLTGEVVTILGVFYANGKALNNESFFHSVIYNSTARYNAGLRVEEQLEKIK